MNQEETESAMLLAYAKLAGAEIAVLLAATKLVAATAVSASLISEFVLELARERLAQVTVKERAKNSRL